jgi:DNA invertase Pin-like site-specific DNA recombinase
VTGAQTTMAGPVRAAQYVRMSTEHQQYSTENQTDAMRRYGEARCMEIVRTYSDAARSGLNLEGRDGLRELLRDVESGRADYTDILVYDVSRWGRFQDADESAYYEYITAAKRIIAQRIEEQRQVGRDHQTRRKLTSARLVREYQQRTGQQRNLVRKANATKEHLLLLTTALRSLFADEHFITLLRAESLSDIPQQLAMRLK